MNVSLSLMLHTTAGLLALLAAVAALTWRKGGSVHRHSGRIFVAAMVLMTGSGTLIALSMNVVLSVIGGVLTLYLVISGWLTVCRKSRRPGLPEAVGLLVVLFIGSLAWVSGLEAAGSATGMKDGFHPAQYYMFGVLAVLAGAGDIRLFVVGGLSGAQRIARHLWRMCMALTIAAAAFFLGQAHLFPAAVRESNVLVVPVLAALVIMLYWLARMAMSRWIRVRSLGSRPMAPAIVGSKTSSALATARPSSKEASQ